MANLTVAVLGAPGYAAGLGKRGTASDLIFYNLKRGEHTLTFVEPTRYPERVAPLFFAVSMADAALLIVDEVNAGLGETILMLDAMGITDGDIIMRNYVEPARIGACVKGTVLDQYRFSANDPVLLREHYFKTVERVAAPLDPGRGTVVVDHAFHVKGIGPVVLGRVCRGEVHRHDQLTLLPGGEMVQVRSIQRHDDDTECAQAGDRVGIALKNVAAEALERGCVLTQDPDVRVTQRVEGEVSLNRYWKIPILTGMVVHLGHWMQVVPARIQAVEGEDPRRPRIRLELEKELVYLPQDRVIVHYLEGELLRVAGVLRPD
ncbi:MAG: EF-Tu/IF-2/RF-3 family GTPase [Methanomicrobiaceae archaeon]|nr:EF-Tu/IF-2/RF-3 family GTPase [Methanomicrobiaceae archaeon]